MSYLAAADPQDPDERRCMRVEYVARTARARVAIGTVFRHFPTKQALLQAIMKDLLGRLTEQVGSLNGRR